MLSRSILTRRMPPWKTILRPCYYAATLPYRWWLRRVMHAEHRAPVIVLAFHRIADDRATPWTVSNRTFVRQMDWLAGRVDLVSLQEAQRRLGAGDNWRTAVCLTFDDGYADNCQEAIPLLVKRRIPCTYFVTVANVLHGKPFDHDLALGQQLPPNNLEQLRAMAGAGIDIGVHGYEHVDLGQIHDPQAILRQVVGARGALRTLLGRPVRYFAFPFGRHGHLSVRAMELAYEAGYEAVCSAYGGYNFPGDYAFHLQRNVIDDSLLQLKNWVTIDPRRIRIPRFPWNPKQPSPTQETKTES